MSCICESGKPWSRKLTTKPGTVMQRQAAAASSLMKEMYTRQSEMRSLNDTTKAGKSFTVKNGNVMLLESV